jgi:hypothetical protein
MIDVKIQNADAKTRNANEQLSVSSQQMLPGAPFLRKSVYSVIDDLQQAEQAVQALWDAGYATIDIHLFASEQFVAAVEHRNQQHSRLLRALLRFFTSTDDGFFGDVYLHEAGRGHHIVVVYLPRAERLEQVRDLLVPYHMHHMKYVGTWTVTDLPSSAMPQRRESEEAVPEVALR